jgi:hypothetical protein
MALPSNVLRLGWILDKTNAREVEAASGQWDREEEYAYANDTTGYADEWENAGLRPVMTDVSGPLAVYSSHASDVASIYVTGQVLDTGGVAPLDYYELGETLILNGATPVTGTNDFFRVDSIAKSADTTGVVRLACQGTVVSRIGPFEESPAYPWVRFMDIPAAGTIFKCGVITTPPRLVNAYQSPPPSVDPDFLVWYASSDIFWQLKEGDRSVGALRKAKDIVKDEKAVELMFGDISMQIVPEVDD